MAQGPERLLQKKVRAFLLSEKRNGSPLWFQKIQDVSTAGIPDFIGAYNSVFWALELKAPGKVPTRLQELTLAEIRAARGIGHWVDNYDDFILFYRGLQQLAGQDPLRTIRLHDAS